MLYLDGCSRNFIIRVCAVPASGMMVLLSSIVPLPDESGSLWGVLEVTPPPAFGGVARWCWDSSHPVVFAFLASVGGTGFFGASGRV